MNFRSLLPLILLPIVLPAFLGGCATAPRTAGTGPQVAVMLVKVKKQKKPERIVIELREDAAPATVANFRQLAGRHYYDGMRFHRLFPHQLVQTGDPKSRHGETGRSGTGGPGYTLPAEIHLKLEKGSVATARLPDAINPTRASNGSQFFVSLEPMSQLNGQYTVFGRVIEGLEVLDAISTLPVNSNDFPIDKIVIQSIRVE
jgi:cyclophilin family peptidyl-prolyl cis-trans isomerase